ncbi:MAG: hypothetical protein MUF38_04710 [Anaerolineae bacterium]|nr:hypothetical protein [Anaerolineae bacterium]
MSETSLTPDVSIRLDDRVRIMAALVAASNYPNDVQRIRPHGAHPHAKTTRKAVSALSNEPAVQQLQALFDAKTPLETIFTLALHLKPESYEPARPLPGWAPTNWAQNVRDFSKRGHLGVWFTKERGVWETAQRQLDRVFQKVAFKPLLEKFFGPVSEKLVFTPNLLYPSEREIILSYEGELICIAPPPLAWGDNPPWEYDDPSMVFYSYKCALGGFGRLLLNRLLDGAPDKLAEAAQSELPVNDQFRTAFPTWREQFTELFSTALVALYLEDYVSDREYRAFVLIEQRMRGMNILPGTVSVMRRFLQERGNKFDTLLDFLTVFPKQLRVAKRMVTL